MGQDKESRPAFPLEDAFVSALAQAIDTNRPIIKGIHEPTGSGKTYSAVTFAVDALLAPNPTIPVYAMLHLGLVIKTIMRSDLTLKLE